MAVEFYEDEEFGEQAKLDRHTLARILSLTEPHSKSLIGFLISIMIVAALDAVFTYLSKLLIDKGILGQSIPTAVRILTLYALLLLVQAVFTFLFIFLVTRLGERIRYDLRKLMFDHLQNLSLGYYSKTPVGWIMARVTSDTERVADLITWGLLDSTWAVTSMVTSLAFMLAINWKLALIVVLTFPILTYIGIEFRKRILGEFRRVRRFNSKITASYNETISGIQVVKALGRERENMQEFGALTEQMYGAAYRAAWLSALFLPVVQIISATALAIIVYFSGYRPNTGMSPGDIHAFVSYVTFMMWPIQDLARVFAEMQHSIASGERIFSLVDTQPDIRNLPNAYDPGSIAGDIEFNNVTFNYDDDPAILDGFSLKVKRGETIALVGPTGGGKTTIVNLLCRFYEPKEGSISIGGHDYCEYSLKAIQSRIGIVLQTPHLFSGTIRENIRYGRLDASDEEVEVAARSAGADDFIQNMPKKYEEDVGEGGGLLSVGQKQLISLARAILVKPEIFIMDEATSSVDTLTEMLIQKGMEELMRDRTSFIIAHRLSTIRRADRILVIEDGKIAESGSHTELLKLRGKYFSLYTRQYRQHLEMQLDLLG